MPGYRPIPAEDAREQELRDRWYATAGQERDAVAQELSAYIWQRTLDKVSQDRLRHPKAKRNQPVPTSIEVGEGRYLP